MSNIVRLDSSAKYSEAVVHKGSGTVYLAGQVPEKTLDKGAKEQTAEVLSLIDALLERAGSDKTMILFAQVFLKDIGDVAAMNEAWLEWVPAGHTAARATVGSTTLVDAAWKVEIVVTAALK